MTPSTDPQHWQAWLDRYGDNYQTDEQRHAAYRDAQANLAELTAVFNSDATVI